MKLLHFGGPYYKNSSVLLCFEIFQISFFFAAWKYLESTLEYHLYMVPALTTDDKDVFLQTSTLDSLDLKTHHLHRRDNI